ncbi:hypothetical protein MMC07_009430 [Pseudocyphellaria aurata]|nr:hypothetical protein [Pseudocyphellaria aurata]
MDRITNATDTGHPKRQYDQCLVERAMCRKDQERQTKLVKPSGKEIEVSPKTKAYFPFPLEIRQLVLQKILEPGEVQVRPQPDVVRVERQRALHEFVHHDPACPISASHLPEIDSDRAPGASSLPAYQILATCKQAYKEGVLSFYTKNTFFLPPGPVEHSINFFNHLTSDTRSLIKTIGIRFDLEDLAPIFIAQQQKSAGSFDKKWMTAWNSDKPGKNFSFACAEKLGDIWFEKLAWVQEWDTVDTAKLEFGTMNTGFDVTGQDLAYYLEDVEQYWQEGLPIKPAESILSTALEAVAEARKTIQDKIDKDGWAKCRDWIVEQQKTRLNLSSSSD